MKVQSVLDFIKEFSSAEVCFTPCDAALLAALQGHFSKKLETDELSSEDLGYILARYKERWIKIKDTPYDYTLSTSCASQKWIDFSKKLQKLHSGSYLSILFPTSTNTTDPNDGSLLTITENLTSFYLGEDNLLYRKRALCDHIQARKHQLSTFRPSSGKDLCSITLDELSRLKRCQALIGAFTITYELPNEKKLEETFANFWDFLRRKSFVRLAESGEIPRALLPHLLELLENYYILKNKSTDFSDFKTATRRFFSTLYRNDLLNVNCLYGQKITYKGLDSYLLDVFLAIFEADKFDLEEEMVILAEFLFRFNPILKARNKEFASYYQKWSPPLISTPEKEQMNAYERSCSLIVSLLVRKFTIPLFSKSSIIAVWDIPNNIPKDLSEVYSDLLSVLSSDKSQHVRLYTSIYTKIIALRDSNLGMFSWIIRDSKTTEWLEDVCKQELTKVGGYWFDSECILSGLSRFDTNNSSLKKKINEFWEETIRTYAQSKPDIEKQLRVNILFSQFLTGLSEEQRRTLIIHITLSDKTVARDSFIHYCAVHINKQLESLGYVLPKTASPLFFSSSSPFEIKPQASTHPYNVLGLITAYTKRMEKDNPENIKEGVKELFFRLESPILTTVQEEEAKNSIPAVRDPVGAPT